MHPLMDLPVSKLFPTFAYIHSYLTSKKHKKIQRVHKQKVKQTLDTTRTMDE